MAKFCCVLAVLALLVAVSLAKPADNSAVEETDTDDLQTAQQFHRGFGFGGGFGGFPGFGGYQGYNGYNGFNGYNGYHGGYNGGYNGGYYSHHRRPYHHGYGSYSSESFESNEKFHHFG